MFKTYSVFSFLNQKCSENLNWNPDLTNVKEYKAQINKLCCKWKQYNPFLSRSAFQVLCSCCNFFLYRVSNVCRMIASWMPDQAVLGNQNHGRNFCLHCFHLQTSSHFYNLCILQKQAQIQLVEKQETRVLSYILLLYTLVYQSQ